MRQLIIKIPKGNKEEILKTVETFEGKNTVLIPLEEEDLFYVYLPNKKVNDFLKKVDQFEEPEVSLIPRGVIALYPPASESPDQVADVQPKSSLEIYLGGIQSVGSIFGLLGYSFVAGIIVWIGLYTNVSYLLVAAMLVAPFAGPAMNAALGTAAGKTDLLKSSLKRYGIAILTGVVASFLMTFLFPITVLTPLMDEISQVSKFAVLLPLVSGFAGAVNICQSERDSLVSGAAVGILVAASLAPPVGLVGAGIYMMDWQTVFSSLFRILLQLLGIHLAATLVFYLYGKVRPDGVRFLKGRRMVGLFTTGIVVLGLGAMMFWQFSQPPFLRKASMKTELTEVLDAKLKNIPEIKVLENQVTFTNEKHNGRSVAIFGATVMLRDSTDQKDEVKARVIDYLNKSIDYDGENLFKVFQIIIVEK